jgi:hypothetical protein
LKKRCAATEEGSRKSGKRKAPEEDQESEVKKGKRRQTESAPDEERDAWRERVELRLERIERMLGELITFGAKIDGVKRAVEQVAESLKEDDETMQE